MVEKAILIFWEGQAAFMARNYELAERKYTEAIELDPTNKVCRVAKANSLESRRKWDDALREYDRLLELFPDFVTTWTQKARLLNHHRLFQEAEMCAENALRLDMSDRDAWTQKGFALGMQHKLDEAVVCFDELIRLSPADGWARKGELLLVEYCDYKNAMSCFDKALNLDGSIGIAWNGKGTVYLCLGLFEEAVKCYDNILHGWKDKFVWTNKGIVLTFQGKFEEAEKCLQTAFSFDPHFTDAYNSLGYLYLHQGKFQEALTWFMNASALEKEEENAAQGKALCEYLMANPRHPTFPDPTGISLQKMDKLNQTKLFFFRGKTLVIFGEVKKTKKAFEKCLELDPNCKAAAIEIDKIKQLRKRKEVD